MTTDENEHNALKMKLYLDFLCSMALEDPSLQDILLDITLGTLINDSQQQESSGLTGQEIFQQKELYAYGTPARRHLSHLTRKRLLLEAQNKLRSITEFSQGVVGTEAVSLPEAIKLCKIDVVSMKAAIRTISSHLTILMMEIQQNHRHLDQEMKHAKAIVFPLYDSARTASVDLLAATIEASLVKLSLTKARSERALYNHRSKQHDGHTVAQAIRAAYVTLKDEERDMKIENQELDRQLQEYETLLLMVDGSNGGYQQVINDWTKVKQEADECMKDLRRLGWSGN